MTAPPRALGLLAGAGAVLAWSIYNVGSKWAVTAGFEPAGLALLRYGVPALLFAPLLAGGRLARIFALGGGRVAILALLGGPPFALLVYQGLAYAPLAHGVVIAPTAVMLTSLGLGVVFGGDRPSARRLAGSGVLVAGLAVFGFESLAAAGLSPRMLIGDLMFILSGALFGGFSFLLQRWRLDPVDALMAVSLPSGLVMLPFVLASGGAGLLAAGWPAFAAQALLQGVLAGAAGIVLYALAVKSLGSAAAGIFPSMTPIVAAVMGLPFLDERPTLIQCLGIAVATAGFLIAVSRGPGEPPKAGA